MPIAIRMPALSPTMEEGTLAKWLVREGDTVSPGDIIAEIETDKATMEVEAVDEGKLGRIMVAAGTEGVPVNQVIALLLEEGEEPGALASATPAPSGEPLKEEPRGKASPPKPATSEPDAAASRANGEGGRIFASPLARRLAMNADIDLAALTGSGPRGRIVKRDVETALEAGVPKRPLRPAEARPPAPIAPPGIAEPPGLKLPDPRAFFEAGSYDEVAHDAMRKSIARRLVLSVQTTPHFYLTIDCEIDALLAHRASLNARAPKDEGAYKLSVNDFVVRAVALALTSDPAVNVTWTEDAMLHHKHADIGVAVAIEGGLITPIVRHAEMKGLAVISNEIAELARRARKRKLKPHEFEGGSFAISNLGMFGVRDFTAIINPPHAAILAVGAGEERPIVKNGALAKATVMTMTMSCDHRAIDGATGARFLKILKGFIEDPVTMLL